MRFTLLAALLLTGCAAPQVVVQTQPDTPPSLAADHAVMSDGYRLPLRRWAGSEPPTAVLLGLHGFNDYSKAFAPLAEDLSRAGIITYAVDQRGFGATAQPGRWHGSLRMASDLRELIGLLRARHPNTRLYVAGESMGGAVAMLAAAQATLEIDGLILIAPAVWSRDTMPWYQRLVLEAAVHTVPWMKLTGEGIRLSPTDNDGLLRAMSADPLVIKATRVDALWGIADLMDAARAHGLTHRQPVLLLYGERDEIIPRNAFCNLLAQLPSERDGLRLVLYDRGWHLLPRDLQGARVRRDIAAWLVDPKAPLPSGEETQIGGARVARLCSP
ncbi:alpha/beta fold hydrolase [Thiocystis violacea]|uniref:alpha/beta fold hydrolase n=1 Tax=Thiocystis violacea TaxID=13725 RepID=UPI001906BA19|nr:alpha/beta fold hydrolase [Thiocystis violacea]MBK1724872.1 alpha/beta hydrolase [Thiocystis violacea]